MSEQNAYILGTDPEELFRLGIQHQVWAEEAHIGWRNAGFTHGQTLLDLGCGPGFCTKELGFISGKEGKVIAVDRSENYIHVVDKIATQYGLNVETIISDFDDLNLPPDSIDGVYTRWVLGWTLRTDDVLQKIYNALKPGGRVVLQEYSNWMTHLTEPSLGHLNKAIKAAFDSFNGSGSDINIGRQLPGKLRQLGMNVINLRLIHKIAMPGDLTWQWPTSFYRVYFPRLVAMGYLTENEVQLALQDLEMLEANPTAFIACPTTIEVIAEK